MIDFSEFSYKYFYVSVVKHLIVLVLKLLNPPPMLQFRICILYFIHMYVHVHVCMCRKINRSRGVTYFKELVDEIVLTWEV